MRPYRVRPMSEVPAVEAVGATGRSGKLTAVDAVWPEVREVTL